jgi:hypothetical protein
MIPALQIDYLGLIQCPAVTAGVDELQEEMLAIYHDTLDKLKP